jgi:hypothetical protein
LKLWRQGFGDLKSVTGNRESFEHHQKLEHRTKPHESKWFPGI